MTIDDVDPSDTFDVEIHDHHGGRPMSLLEDYEPSGCPACGDRACQFPPACQAVVGPAPERGYPHHDSDKATA